jgi:SPP1 family predicted phage head-tail adaptor
MRYSIGELDQRVELVSVSTEKNEYGTLGETETSLGTVWAHVRPMSGRERDHAQQTDARADYLVVIRTRGDLSEKDRIVWRGETLNVRFVKHRSNREQFMEIEAEMGAP